MYYYRKNVVLSILKIYLFIYMYVGEHEFTTMVCTGAKGQRALVHSVLLLT